MHKLIHITEKSKRIAVGLMSGTSLDGIDAALVAIDGSGPKTSVQLLHFFTQPYNMDEKENILRLCDPSTSTVDQICHLNVSLGEKMAQAALEVIRRSGMTLSEVDFISSHGQTIYHMPEKLATLQIGELAVIAERTGCITVGDFRPADMAAGGQGAPLVPFTDYLLFHDDYKGRVLLNIGGISNVTVIKAAARPEEVTAFDTGPGNMLIDAIVRIGTNNVLEFDKNGALAAAGKICDQWLIELLQQDAFIHAEPPKSTGREYYSYDMALGLWNEGRDRGLSLEDIVSTVTGYTVQSIRMNLAPFINRNGNIHEMLVGGGGVHNKTLMKMLKDSIQLNIMPMETLGISSDAKEAVAFALLGNEFISGRCNNLPSATGAGHPVIMGKLCLNGCK